MLLFEINYNRFRIIEIFPPKDMGSKVRIIFYYSQAKTGNAHKIYFLHISNALAFKSGGEMHGFPASQI